MTSHYFNTKFLKATCIIFMILMHGLVWLNNNSGKAFTIQDNSFLSNTTYLHGLYSLMLPACAGLVFRINLDKYFVGNTFLNFPIRKIISFFAFLVLTQSVSSYLSFGISHFFYWNVLHFIGLSYLIIVLMLNISIYYLMALGIFVLCTSSLLRSFLSPYLFNNYADIPSNIKFMGLIMSLSLFGYFLSQVFVSVNIKKTTKAIASLLILIFSLYFTLNYLRSYDFMPLTSLAISNLPIGIVIGDNKLFHIWPLFPWFSTVVFGFCISHFYSISENKYKYKIFTFVLGIIFYGYFILFKLSSFYNSLDSKTLWGKNIFQLDAYSVIGVLGGFCLNLIACNWVDNKIKFSKFSYITIMSENIIVIYLFMMLTGPITAKFLLSKMDLSYSYFVFPAYFLSTSYLIGAASTFILGNKTYKFSFKRKKSI